MAATNNVSILRFPSHTTHLLQPLDLSFFGPLKNVLAKIIRNRVTGEGFNDLGKEMFAGILEEAWNSLDTSCLKRGFAITGILTDTGIDKTVIQDSQISASLPYTEEGIQLIELTKEELTELNLSEDDPSESFALLKLKNIVTNLSNPPQIKRKTISM